MAAYSQLFENHSRAQRLRTESIERVYQCRLRNLPDIYPTVARTGEYPLRVICGNFTSDQMTGGVRAKRPIKSDPRHRLRTASRGLPNSGQVSIMMAMSCGMKTLRPGRDHQVISAANLDLAESAAFIEWNSRILGMHGQGYLLVSRLPCAA